MIQNKHITDEYRGRDEVLKRIKLTRSAAEADMDCGRWEHRDVLYNEGKANYVVDDKYSDPLLRRFEFESSKSYYDRLQFAVTPGYTQLVVDSFSGIFAKVEKTLEIQGLNQELEEKIRTNIDNNGTDFEAFLTEAFRELLITAQAIAVTDSDDMPYAYIVKREQIRNLAKQDKEIAFITWDAEGHEVSGIKCEYTDQIYIITPEELAIAQEVSKDKFDIIISKDNPLGYVPVRVAVVNDSVPMVMSIAKIEHNLMNVDNEMRKIIRDQAGLNILVVPDMADLKNLSSRSMIKIPPGQDIFTPQWVAYPSNSMQSQFGYIDRWTNQMVGLSKLRQQKNFQESGVAKQYDFTQTEAVLNETSNKLEEWFEGVVIDMGNWSTDSNVSVNLEIDRDFDVSDLGEDIDNLLKLIAADMGQTYTAYAKEQFINKWDKVPEEVKEKITDELNQGFDPGLMSERIEDA